MKACARTTVIDLLILLSGWFAFRPFDWKQALVVVLPGAPVPCSLASQGFQAVLALEVTRRTASAFRGHTPAHRSHGDGVGASL
jgi:hypothetical protein